MNNPSEKLIAVVGTMKAGKSTVINAIVGREVLPTRELPMTTIPTLVRHVPGQTEPVLEFSQKSTIEALLPQLATAISNPKNTSIIESSLCCSYNDQLIPSILDFVYRNKKLKKQYTGSIQILEFLRSLNDFTGLCRYLDIDFPFEKFNHIQNLPTISVEFQSLKYLNNPAQVQLALLDTPGPNESGQVHLREMLQDQLEKSSAVLAILDYTQLKSDANEEVNSYLIKIASISKGRLYALVNKFDEQGENSLELDEVKNLVANQLLKKEISEDCVFPVSSRNAYLANRALNALDLHQELPDHETEPWVEDFGLQAFGRRWKNNISDLVETKYAANDLWNESLLQEPLNAILQSLTKQSHHHKNQIPENKATTTVTSSHLSFLKSKSMPITIQDLQAEAHRLMELEINILQNMLETDGILSSGNKLSSDNKQEQTFDTESTKKEIEILKGEQEKLKHLETVIAVVGTMKAGKSTTINAIVGSEVLPNRELPMTAIPTLIRHTVGQTEPVLEFNHKTPIDNLLPQLVEAINNPANQREVAELHNDEDTQTLITSIEYLVKNRKSYQSTYTGTNEIFSFLKGLNDLVRLSKKLNIKFPFESYQNIREIPVIRVEFHALREINQTNGQLTLLDTPGPNEHGQTHLKPMLKDQLKKASAVLAVLDYTQLNSDSNVEVNNEIEEISEINKNRLYAVLNKFDNADRNSKKPENIINFVSNTLMKGNIKEEHIFPVSSKQAYLANRARHELSKNQQLPEHENEPWVADFGTEAFGTRWKKCINDIEAVKEAADDLWKNSLFEKPLDNIIKSSHEQAANLAIKSASSKITKTSNNLNNFLSITAGALNKDITSLNKQVSELDAKLKKIEDTKNNISRNLDDTTSILSNQISEKTKQTHNDLSSEIDDFFKTGKDIEKKEYDIAINHLSRKNKNIKISTSLKNFFQRTSQQKSPENKEERLFDPKSPIIRIEKESDAKKLIKDINKSISQRIKLSENWLNNEMASFIQISAKEFSETVNKELKNSIEEIEKLMSQGGFHIKLTPPNIEGISLAVSNIEISDFMNEKQESYTYRTWEGGWWNELLNKINDDWGYTEKTGTRNYYQINIESIRKKTEEIIGGVFSKDIEESIETKIKEPLKESFESYFDDLQDQIQKIQGTIRQGIENNKKSKEDINILILKLTEMMKNLPALERDSQELAASIETPTEKSA